jgi:predicted dehydrogenase/nucleoside-diphosphate-sugar epimerase
MNEICLVGAGNIARIHADALRALGRKVACVVDPNETAAARLATSLGGVRTYKDVDAAIAAGGFSRAHVLVPPDLHEPVALPLLRAGMHVLLEKPLAVTSAGCARLTEAAAQGGAVLGVNQNFVHHPAFAALRKTIAAGRLGRPRFAACIYHAPLRQMAARQFGHWMFQAPGNILLEQAVHPLSQLVALAGPVEKVAAVAGPALEIAPGLLFVREITATLGCRDMAVQFRQMAGADFPTWTIEVTCDDGVAIADMLNNRFYARTRTGLLEAVDQTLSGLRTAGAVAAYAVGNLVSYARAQAKLGPRSDPFYQSMVGSLRAFHDAVDRGAAPELDAAFGAGLVATCERLAESLPATPALAAPAVRSGRAPDVVVLGGTGFIGTHLVRNLTGAGLAVGVMARSMRALPAVFAHPDVQLVRGDIGDAAAVADAIGDAPIVINLAHGGGGATYADIERAMVGGAETVARACMTRADRKLLHVGSIAALYLGDPAETITGATPPDPRGDERADYARAKAVADRRLLALHRDHGLNLVLLRPGVVVGEGTSPFHSGVGLFNNEQHCIGWNDGRNPLPFILVSDLAEALRLAAATPGLAGRSYNLVGGVRPSARDYIAALAAALRRPLRFHPQRPEFLWTEDMGKWLVKRASGRAVAQPSLRDFRSRGMPAKFDCSDAERDLGWAPVNARDEFDRQAIQVHAA